MKENYTESLTAVLKHEGGYANNPKDPGGATMRGVTQAVYDAYRRNAGRPTQSVRAISDAELGAIYRGQYWDRVRGDDLPSGIDYAVFDFAVNSGARQAIKYLQQTLGITADGVIGNITLATVRDADPVAVINELCDRRLSFMKRIKHRTTGELLWKEFGRGWSSRVAGVRKMAQSLAKAPKPPQAPSQQEAEKPAPRPPVSRPQAIGGLIAALLALAAMVAGWFGFDLGGQ